LHESFIGCEDCLKNVALRGCWSLLFHTVLH